MLEVKIFWKIKMLKVKNIKRILKVIQQKLCLKLLNSYISWITKNPVSKVYLASWFKTVLSLSRIDSKFFFLLIHIEVLHYPLRITKEYLSTISASDWTNADTFLNHYYAQAHASYTTVGQMILNESPLEG